jgi:hypothetical protein
VRIERVVNHRQPGVGVDRIGHIATVGGSVPV